MLTEERAYLFRKPNAELLITSLLVLPCSDYDDGDGLSAAVSVGTRITKCHTRSGYRSIGNSRESLLPANLSPSLLSHCYIHLVLNLVQCHHHPPQNACRPPRHVGTQDCGILHVTKCHPLHAPRSQQVNSVFFSLDLLYLPLWCVCTVVIFWYIELPPEHGIPEYLNLWNQTEKGLSAST